MHWVIIGENPIFFQCEGNKKPANWLGHNLGLGPGEGGAEAPHLPSVPTPRGGMRGSVLWVPEFLLQLPTTNVVPLWQSVLVTYQLTPILLCFA